jgi:hypothetical protein
MPGWKYAFSLSKEALEAATPPGTVVLIGKESCLALALPLLCVGPFLPRTEYTNEHKNGRYVDRVVKYPIPTDDSADPLNWPAWRKVACMLSVSWYAFVANYISASMAPALPLWNHAFPHDRRPLKDLMDFIAVRFLSPNITPREVVPG